MNEMVQTILTDMGLAGLCVIGVGVLVAVMFGNQDDEEDLREAREERERPGE